MLNMNWALMLTRWCCDRVDSSLCCAFFFFFQAEDGIRDVAVTGVQTCALPICNEAQTHWIATLQYAYGEPSKDPRVRRWNPLGFKVVDFHAEPEVLPVEPAPRGTAGGSAGSRPTESTG